MSFSLIGLDSVLLVQYPKCKQYFTILSETMKKIASKCFSLLIYFLCLILFSCTSNPIGDNDISSGQRDLTGIVQLGNGHSPEGVYVWMEEFNISTWTDTDGSFILTIPPSFKDVSGLFKVYFFVANYNIDSVQVVVREGQFLYDNEALNIRGELREAVRLEQFLKVSSDVTPQTVTRVNNINVTMTFSLTMQTINGVASVVLPNTVPGFLSSVFFHNVVTGELYIFKGQSFTTSEELQIGSSPVTREMDVIFTRINLPAGKYQLIPYLLIQRDDLPENLVESIAVNVLAFGPNYLKLPFKREGGEFEIKE